MIDPAEAIDALLAELRRQKAEGVRLVNVSAESLQALKALSGAPVAPVPPTPRPAAAPSAPAAAVPRRDAPGAASTPVPVPVPRPAVAPAVVRAAPVSRPVPEPPVFTLPEGSKEERMAALVAIIRACEETRRHLEPGQQPVLGHGALDAKVLFIGEAPGPEEVESGRPFAGDSGDTLRRILKTADIREEEAYFAPLMPWRPEPPTKFGKRPPNAREVAFNLPYLRAQIEIVRPRVIVTLGAQALDALLPGAARITSSHGQWQEYAGFPLLPTFHPSYIIHSPGLTNKRALWEDFMLLMQKLGLPISEKQRGFFLPAAKPADSAD